MRRALRDLGAVIVACGLMLSAFAVAATAATGSTTVSGVLNPVNGVWLDSADGGHYWDANGNGICRVDGTTETASTCDLQAKKPTQVVVGPQRSDGTYFLYVADMSSASIGPLRLVYDPNADSGKGRIVLNSATLEGGFNTIGFFGDTTGNFRSSSVALGPCDAVITTPCTALYVAFEKSPKIVRVNFADLAGFQQSIETISVTDDLRKGVRYGMADFHNADGTDDLYVDELGGEGVSVTKDVAHCTPTAGSPFPGGTVTPGAGCQSVLVPGIATNFAQGMAVQRNADGTGRYLYVADSPESGATATVLRYHPATGFEDVVSAAVTPYASLTDPGQTVSTYTGIGGLAVNPHNGDVYVADDPTLLNETFGETPVGHIFRLPGDGTQTVPAECTGSATNPCLPPFPPATVTGSLYAYGVTAPSGGATVLPSDDGGHVWVADANAGLCRFDVVPQAPTLHASNPATCEHTVTHTAGQIVYDDTIVPGTTNDHYIYVAQTDPLSPGVIRFRYQPSADSGAGAILVGSVTIMVPGQLNGNQADGLALGPCRSDAPATCTHSLYVVGLADGLVRRINSPEDEPGNQTLDIVAITQPLQNGKPGKGVGGSISMLGDSLFLGETNGFTTVAHASSCGVNNVFCATLPLNIGIFGSVTGTATAVDANPAHSTAGLVYAVASPDTARATIYQYDIASATSRIYAVVGQMPAAGSPAATVYCSLTCTLPADPAYPPGSQQAFRVAQGVFVNPYSTDGTVYVTDDANGLAAEAGTVTTPVLQRGHVWTTPFAPFNSGTAGGEQPPVTPPARNTNLCAVTIPVPALAVGATFQAHVTSHKAAPLTSSWELGEVQSARIALSSPTVNLEDSDESTTLRVGTGPTAAAAGTYTAEFANNGTSSLDASTATVTYDNDAGTACAASAQAGHVGG
jgi:hypothetical protein